MFTANARNIGEITYVPTKHDFLYLAVFIHISPERSLDRAMDTRIRDSLVLSALNQALEKEHPTPGLIVHTDRGAQYMSQRFQALLSQCDLCKA